MKWTHNCLSAAFNFLYFLKSYMSLKIKIIIIFIEKTKRKPRYANGLSEDFILVLYSFQDEEWECLPLDLGHRLPCTSPKRPQFPFPQPFLQPNSHSFDQQLLATYSVPHIHSQSKTTNTWWIMNASLNNEYYVACTSYINNHELTYFINLWPNLT